MQVKGNIHSVTVMIKLEVPDMNRGCHVIYELWFPHSSLLQNITELLDVSPKAEVKIHLPLTQTKQAA